MISKKVKKISIPTGYEITIGYLNLFIFTISSSLVNKAIVMWEAASTVRVDTGGKLPLPFFW